MTCVRTTGTLGLIGITMMLTVMTACRDKVSITTRERGLALVIGNSNYRHASYLATAEEDARAIGASLTRFGFKVIPKTNLTKSQLTDEVMAFIYELHQHKHSVGLIYYSGHGVQVEGRTYLWPVDGNPLMPDTLYSVSALTFVLNEAIPTSSPTDGGIIILDACRDESNGAKGLADPTAVPPGILIAYAAHPNNIASARPSPRGLSLYTDALVEALSTPDTTLRQVLTAVAASLAHNEPGQAPYDTQSGPLGFRFDPRHSPPPPPGGA